jgi:hypothetical protein
VIHDPDHLTKTHLAPQSHLLSIEAAHSAVREAGRSELAVAADADERRERVADPPWFGAPTGEMDGVAQREEICVRPHA